MNREERRELTAFNEMIRRHKKALIAVLLPPIVQNPGINQTPGLPGCEKNYSNNQINDNEKRN